jgi:hypothetical protein
MEQDPSSWLRSKDRIGDALRAIARQAIPYATALKVAAAIRESTGNVDIMPAGIGGSVADLVAAFTERVSLERQRVATTLDVAAVESLCRDEFAKLETSFADGSARWQRDIPGRIVLNQFASKAQIQVGRLKTLYLRHAQTANPRSIRRGTSYFSGLQGRDAGANFWRFDRGRIGDKGSAKSRPLSR